MSKKKEPFILENVLIESVAAEGKAIAHIDGMVLFVEFAVPGDVVDVKVFKKKKNYMEGYTVRTVTPSPDRLKPFCPHFGFCGGCRWQPLPYAMQLEAKGRQVYDQLVRLGHLDVPEIRPTLPSPQTEYYRNKLEFTASYRRWIYKEEDPESIPPEDWPGQPEPSNAIRLFIKRFCIEHGYEFFNIRDNEGYFRNMFVRTTERGTVMLIVCFFYEDVARRTALLDAVAEAFPQITSLYYVINGKMNDSISDQECILYRGDEAIYEEMEGLRFKIGPKSFYQTNSRQAERLYGVAREFAALTGNEVVYDLYTGTGTIAQFVSRKARKVIGIEYVPEAIADARINAQTNGITNCEFFAGDMKDVLTDAFIARHGRPDVIILDPPRAGIHPDVAQVILNAAPDRMVYVSCNPASQARDLAILCRKYTITAVQPVDMFPHTMHVENVVALQKKEDDAC